MSHVPHELTEEFPNDIAKLTRLKVDNAHVARLADEYHQVNREIHRAETNVEPCSDTHALDLRRRRLQLKDQIAQCLASAV